VIAGGTTLSTDWTAHWSFGPRITVSAEPLPKLLSDDEVARPSVRPV
jgi:hypothetical protein